MSRFLYVSGVVEILFYIIIFIDQGFGLDEFIMRGLMYVPAGIVMIGMGRIIELLEKNEEKQNATFPSLLSEGELKGDGKWKCFNCNRKNGADVEVCECGRKREDN